VYNDGNIYHRKGIRSFDRKRSQQKKITALKIRIAEPVVGITFFFPSFVCMSQPNNSLKGVLQISITGMFEIYHLNFGSKPVNNNKHFT
jgi:hypothetical protein